MDKTSQRFKILDFDGDFQDAAVGFMPVTVKHLFPGTILPFDIYFPALSPPGRSVAMQKIFSRQEVYDRQSHDALLSRELDTVYIRGEDADLLSSYIVRNLKSLVSAPGKSPVEKAQVLYSHAEFILQNAFNDKPTVQDILLGLRLTGVAAVQFTADEVAATELISIFSKDYYTFTHSVQVSFLGMAFCSSMGWPRDEVVDYGIGALFHDIGKSRIDESILNKPSKLEEHEFNDMKRHPVIGYEQLRECRKMSEDQLSVVLQHHEDYDGNGYPARLKGDEIHKYARIARIVDCFDALTTRRVYKEALDLHVALDLMKGGMRRCFDESYLEAFCSYCSAGREAVAGITRPKHLCVELGCELQVQFEASGRRTKAGLVGMKTGSYVIANISAATLLPEETAVGSQVVVRYLWAGTVYGFKSAVIDFMPNPFRLLILSYPTLVELQELRGCRRIESYFPCTLTSGSVRYEGMIVDLSIGGCRFMTNLDDLDSPVPGDNDPIELHCRLPGDADRDVLPARVKNIQTEDGRLVLGVQFLALPPALLAKVKDYVDRIIDLLT